MEYGTFDIGTFDQVFENMETPEMAEDDIVLYNLIVTEPLEDQENINYMEISASTEQKGATKEMTKALDMDKVPLVPTVRCTKQVNRFKRLSEEEIETLEITRRSQSTMKSTSWGVKVFQDWCFEVNGHEVDFRIISPVDLNNKLRRFYAEATPRINSSRTKNLGPEQALEYHKNSFKSIRSAINRHLQDLGRDIDIVRDKTFKPANITLDGKLKQNVRQGLSRPTKHKAIINSDDLVKINSYLYPEDKSINPIILRYRVWYDLSIHFVSRGLEFHRQLNLNSFEFCSDENGVEYVRLTHETIEKTRQGGLENDEDHADKRMYAYNDTSRCPVNSLRLLISKTSTTSKSLFNHCYKPALTSPNAESTWYTDIPVKEYQFTKFLPDITRNSGCSQTYTAHSLRATAIQKLNDSGVELRHIMYMSGHRNESSVRSYNRHCSFQKRHLSTTLSALKSSPKQIQNTASLSVPSHANHSSSTPSLASVSPRPLPIPCSTYPVQGPLSLNSSNFLSSGFISNSSFNNCVFQFKN